MGEGEWVCIFFFFVCYGFKTKAVIFADDRNVTTTAGNGLCVCACVCGDALLVFNYECEDEDSNILLFLQNRIFEEDDSSLLGWRPTLVNQCLSNLR